LQINQDCGFFKWLDIKMCSFGKKVVHRLHQRHKQLEAQAKRCQTLVQVEVGKVKAKNEKKIVQLKAEMEREAQHMREQLVNEISNYCKQIEIKDIKMHAIKKNYHTIIVCSWIVLMFALCTCFFGGSPNRKAGYNLGHGMLS
jgi:wobble nucleotide-excising tRNase